jgi:hypothetical protein
VQNFLPALRNDLTASSARSAAGVALYLDTRQRLHAAIRGAVERGSRRRRRSARCLGRRVRFTIAVSLDRHGPGGGGAAGVAASPWSWHCHDRGHAWVTARHGRVMAGSDEAGRGGLLG